jgi:hypothetical protein
MSPAGVPALSTRSGPTADEVLPPAWPRLPRLLLLRRGGWRGKPGCCSSAIGGKTSSSSPSPGELTSVVVAVAPRGEEYHVVAAVEGHELETPEAEQRPWLKRLMKTTHLELNGKVFVNTQHAPTWRANCRRFGPGGPSTEPTSEFIAACPCLDGLAQDGTQGEMRLVLSRTEGCS